jgi:hypothetical protein
MQYFSLPLAVFPSTADSLKTVPTRSSRGALRGFGALLVLAGIQLAQAAPVITNQPASQTIFYGDPVTFRVGASGASLYYQWYRNGARITGANTSQYSISAVTSNDNGAGFSVIVTNTTGLTTSTAAVLTVDFGVAGPLQTTRLLSVGDNWKYNQTAIDLGTDWILRTYSDSGLAWSNGPGAFDAKSTPRATVAGETVGTQLALKQSGTNRVTYYFRTHMDFHPWTGGDGIDGSLNATAVIDDGAVFYINGKEGYRVGVDSTTYDAWSSRTVVDPTSYEYFTLPVTNMVDGDNVIAVEVHQCNATSSDISFALQLDSAVYPRLRDTNAPVVVELIPAAGSTVPSLNQLEVHLSEGVKGVHAADLLINGLPAANVTAYSPDVYVFEFPQPPTGVVQVAWASAAGIIDLSANSNLFSGGTYGYVLNPNALITTVRINEFMTGNTSTVRDDDGHYSDWIELYNAGDQPVSIGRWYLTDNPAKLNKWQFPVGLTMPGRSYLLVWASGEDRTNLLAPLHTSFKLDKGAGNYLGLVYLDGATVVSAFSSYAQQYDDVSYGCDRLDTSLVGYFTNATPGAANATLGPGMGPEVRFSVMSRTFVQPFTLALSTTTGNCTIRYVMVTNGTYAAYGMIPTASSPAYTGPITISGSTQVRARAFPNQAGFLPGPLHNETFLQLAQEVTSASSDLPMVVFHNMGGGAVAATAEQFMTMQVFETRNNGRSSLLNPPDLSVQGYFHRRGQATFWNPKASLRVETQDVYGDDLEVEVLGMPGESDWVFYGINCFDKVLMHNPLAHQLYADMGHYTSRTRFVEVYLKDDSGTPGPITAADYNGLYVLEEKIKIDKNRVDIDRLQPENTNAPSVTGGYLLSIDKSNPGSSVFIGNEWVWYLDPDYYELTSAARAAQKQYIDNYFDDFYAALTGPNWTDPALGYRAYIDMDSWIDNHLQNTFVFNVDMLRISAYFYKPRNGKIVQGPLWDFDRAFGDSNDDRGFNPRLWRSQTPDYGTDPFNPGNTFDNPWYSIMFQDPDFWQRWIDRYQELRKNIYSLTNLYAKIDDYGNQVREATVREYVRWAGGGGSDTTPRSGYYSGDGFAYTFPTPGTWQGEINFTKYWFSNRVDFMDSELLNPPVFNRGGGPITSGTTLTITASTREANSTIYYTLDGTDPRLSGGGVSPSAIARLNTATITLNNNARVVARNFNAAHQNQTGPNCPPISSSWSGPTAATFVVATPLLAITEIMYHPQSSGTNAAGDFEFIELKNVGTLPLSLLGVHFTNGIDFTFRSTNAITSLTPGQYLVIVRNRAGFVSRYPGVTNIAGEYRGSLENAGERLCLEGALKEPILDFKYNDSWYPITDGQGFSLVIRNESAPFYTWTNSASWRVSAALNGSPGRIDPALTTFPPIVISEALTHTDPPQVDTIELYNPTASPVRIDGWFISDDRQDPLKFRIPTNSIVPAFGYVLFTENDYNTGTSNSFALSSLGEEVYLFSGDGTNITGYLNGFEFGPQVNGVTFGRHVSSDGIEHFVTEKANTLGLPNSGPQVGPIVINEIMYAPPRFGLDPDQVDEYIELRNFSGYTVPLYDPLHATNTWKLDGGVQFTFPPGLTMAPWSFLLVVSFDAAQDPAARSWLCSHYGIDTATPMVGPYQGSLENAGERIGLYRPDKPEIPPSPLAGFVPYVLVEDVHYSWLAPWPVNTHENGNSLQRISSGAFADDPANWTGAAPSPCQINPASLRADSDNDGLPDEWEIAYGLDPSDPAGVNGASGDLDHDGMSNLQEYLAGTSPVNPDDLLDFDSVTIIGSNCVLQFTPRAGRTYTIERLDALGPINNWTTLVGNITGTTQVTRSDPVVENARFYRIRASLTP